VTVINNPNHSTKPKTMKTTDLDKYREVEKELELTILDSEKLIELHPEVSIFLDIEEMKGHLIQTRKIIKALEKSCPPPKYTRSLLDGSGQWT